MKLQGASGTPKVVTSLDEIDDLIYNKGHIETFRGASPEAVRSYIEGEYQTGVGIYGNGYYSAIGETRTSAARSYIKGHGTPGNPESGYRTARNYALSNDFSDEGGHVMRIAIDPDARLITEADLWDLVSATAKADKAAGLNRYLDPGRVAAANGYDAVVVAQGEYVVILNREVTTVFNVGGTNTAAHQEMMKMRLPRRPTT
jgi:hypothetical protein